MILSSPNGMEFEHFYAGCKDVHGPHQPSCEFWDLPLTWPRFFPFFRWCSCEGSCHGYAELPGSSTWTHQSPSRTRKWCQRRAIACLVPRSAQPYWIRPSVHAWPLNAAGDTEGPYSSKSLPWSWSWQPWTHLAFTWSFVPCYLPPWVCCNGDPV